jgi:hypothetical protein
LVCYTFSSRQLFYEGPHSAVAVEFPGVKYPGVNYSGVKYLGVNYSGINPSGVSPSGVNTPRVNSSGINSSGTNPSGANSSSFPGVVRVVKSSLYRQRYRRGNAHYEIRTTKTAGSVRPRLIQEYSSSKASRFTNRNRDGNRGYSFIYTGRFRSSIDIVRINQADAVERSKQVLKTKQIYEQAESIDIRLGPGDE